ncbi:MAG TPA: polysaccharide deacetylase family protein [Pyrinomonadaceae bacterium]|nr:polysaccharide deacetylase family protein [Pyrinomonadaceae bacterium]
MSIRAISIMYHDVVAAAGDHEASGFPGTDAALYKLDRQQFAAHLRAIAGRVQADPITASPRLAENNGVRMPLLITFDDGGLSAYTHIADMLEEHNWRGHFFVTTDYIGAPSFLNREQIRELDARGHIIGSHSCSHPMRMSRCPWPQMLREWKESVAVLSEITGKPVKIASVPGGHYSRKVAATASLAGIETLFTSEPATKGRVVDDCLVLGRYAIQRWTSPEMTAAIANGEIAPRLRQTLLWNAKKVTKTFGGEYYLKIRKSLLERAGPAAGE